MDVLTTQTLSGVQTSIEIAGTVAFALSGVMEARDRTKAGATAPPEGLTLEWVDYPEDPWTVERRTTD
jgi:tRNA U38,U39,U40 pseudouridine synthase TruA